MKRALVVAILAATCLSLQAQQAGSDSDRQQKLTLGGYGEVALTRNFYSDNVYRYSSAACCVPRCCGYTL